MTRSIAALCLSPFLSMFLSMLLVQAPLRAHETEPPAAHSEDHDTEGARHLVLLVTSGLSGHLVSPDDTRTIASLVAQVRAEAAAARAAGHDVVVFDAGRTLVPYAESRADDGRTMSEVLRALEIQAFAPAPLDLTFGLARIGAIAQSTQDAFPTLRSFDSDDEEVQLLAPSARIELDAQDDPAADGPVLEIRSIFDEGHLSRLRAVDVDARRYAPSDLEPIDPRALRLLIVHSRSTGDSLVERTPTWSLVDQPHGFDLLLDPDLGSDLSLRRQTDNGPVFLVGRSLSTANPWTWARVDIELTRDGARWRPDHVDLTIRSLADPSVLASPAPPDPALEATIRERFGDFRFDWGEPIEVDDLATRDLLIGFALEAIRDEARAEVVLLNEGSFRPVAERYWQRGLTPEVVLRLLTIDQQLQTGTLTGAQLRALARESSRRQKRETSLRVLGLDWPKGADWTAPAQVPLTINGRPLQEKDRYRIVTNTYLTSGGDQYAILAEEVEGLETLRRDNRILEARDDVVLPRMRRDDPLWDPALRPLWRYGVRDLRLDASEVSIDASSDYAEVSDSRASASSSAQARLDLELFANQDWPLLRWENRLRVRFGLIETDEVEELTDDLRLEVSTVFHRGGRLRGKPYLSYLFDSELRRNEDDDGVRLPRQREESLAAGLSWTADRWPRIRAGVLARYQDDTETAERLGLVGEAWYRLPPTDTRPGFDVDILGEWVDGGDATITRIDLDLRLVVQLKDRLSLKPGIELYRYDDSRLDGAAEYRGLSLALAWSWIDKAQR